MQGPPLPVWRPDALLPGRRLQVGAVGRFACSKAGSDGSSSRCLRLLVGDYAWCTNHNPTNLPPTVASPWCRRVGGYDSRLPIMEDADLCARMHLAGGPAGGLPGSHVQPMPAIMSPTFLI
jgi:hypothetical protein